jgi:hypothetical protein
VSLPGWNDASLDIDRIDNNKGYERNNLRFVPRQINLRNKRVNRWITHNGVSVLVLDFWKQYAPAYRRPHTITRKIKEGKDSDTIIAEQNATRGTYGQLAYEGEHYTLRSFRETFCPHLSGKVVEARHASGWAPERIIQTPTRVRPGKLRPPEPVCSPHS